MVVVDNGLKGNDIGCVIDCSGVDVLWDVEVIDSVLSSSLLSCKPVKP